MSNNRSNKINLQKYEQNTLFPLPIETKLHIMSFLNRKELATSSQVCKEWNVLAQDKSLPALQVPDYQHASEPNIIATNILAITQSDDGRYIAMVSSEDVDDFTLLDTETNTSKLKITMNADLPAATINLALTPDNKHLIITYYRGINDLHLNEFNRIDIWDLEQKQKICKYEDLMSSPGISPCLPLVQIISNNQFIVSFTPLQIYNVNNQCKNIYLCDVNNANIQMVESDSEYENGYYRASCISPNKEFFARIINNSLYIHEAKTGKKTKSIFLPDYEISESTNIQFTNDNQSIYMVCTESNNMNAGNFYKIDFKNPFLLKINCSTGSIEGKTELFVNSNLSIHYFILLPDNHLALMSRDYGMLSNKISIWDLTNKKLINDVVLTPSKIFVNHNGSQIYVLTNDGQLNKINVPLFHELKMKEREQPSQVTKLQLR